MKTKKYVPIDIKSIPLNPNSILHVRVGNNDNPATQEDISQVTEQLSESLANERSVNVFVSSHAMDISTVPTISDAIYIVRVGNKDFPASREDIENTAQSIKEVLDEKRKKSKKKLNAVITHHAFEIETLLKNSRDCKRLMSKRGDRECIFI